MATQRARVMRRVVVEAVPTDRTDTVLDEAAAHYVGRVLRLRDGDEIELLDGAGHTAIGRLAWRAGVAWVTSISTVTVATRDVPLVLLAALLKASRWEWMIEKAGELGATHVVPVQADRCVVQVPPRKAAAKLERWGRIGAAAARQSQQMQAPVFNAPAPLSDALTQVDGCALVRLDFDGDPGTLVEAAQGPIALIVGPEGGFTDAERALLIEHGARAASLGAAVLRAETAAVAALAAVRLHRTIR